MDIRRDQPVRNPIRWGLVALLVMIGIGTLLTLSMAAYNVSEGLILWVQGDAAGATYFLTAAASSLARILLLLPAAYYAVMALMGRLGRHLGRLRHDHVGALR